MATDSYTLRELEAQLTRITEPGRSYEYVDSLEDAQGIWFLCPKCYQENGGAVGTHQVLCWFADRGVSDEESPGPGRWNTSGTGLDDLSFVGPRAASVLLTDGCRWHGFVRQGRATLK